MPRVTVTENYEDFSAGKSDDPMNNNLDYCKDCYADLILEVIATEYGVPDEAVEMPASDGVGYEDEFAYTCEQCGCELTERDH